MRTESYVISPEADDDHDLPEQLEDLTVAKNAGHRNTPRRRSDPAARKAIEDYHERKRMRELLNDELFPPSEEF